MTSLEDEPRLKWTPRRKSQQHPRRHWSGRTVYTDSDRHKISLFLLLLVIVYILVIVVTTIFVSTRSTADPVALCEELMGVEAEHVKVESDTRMLVWVGDGSEKYCYAFIHDDRWVVSGQ